MRRLRNSVPPARRTKVDVNPVRVALAAVRRIREAGFRLERRARIDEGVGSQEIAAREAVAMRQLPPSYIAVLRHVRDLGAPDQLLDAAAMTVQMQELRRHPTGSRHLPFALADGKLLCFDLRNGQDKDGELPVVAWQKGYGVAVARHFAEWLDAVADRREERLAAAANVPPRLRALLLELGFGAPRGLSAEVETADSDAVEALVGADKVDALLADGSLYDATGKALLQLQLDDFSMRVRLRDGVVHVLAEDVFPWLRSFRDEDFFADLPAPLEDEDLENQVTQIHLPNQVRDLRRAAPRPAAREHGVVQLLSLGAERHSVLDAAGSERDGITLLARVTGSMRSLLLRLEGNEVIAARYVDEALSRIHLCADGTLWALGGTTAHRFRGFEHDRFSLNRPSEGPINWLDLGGHGDRVLVWGAGALLTFDDDGAFVPFTPDLALHPAETVIAVEPREDSVAALIVREGFGAVAHFDGDGWLPIHDDTLIAGAPVDLRTFAGQEWILEARGALYTQSGDAAPRLLPLSRSAAAFSDESGKARPLYELLPGRLGLLMASQGGFVFAPTGGEATFYRGQGEHLRARLCRVEDGNVTLALLGGAVWRHHAGVFHPLDLTAF